MTGQSLSWGSRIVYGIGKSPDIIKLLSFDTFILFYYSQVLGLPGTLAGLAIFLVICADAVWDPIVGTFSDGLKNARFGRRLTPMIYATVPAALAFYILFSPPHGLPTVALFAWMLGSAVFLRCSMTFYQIPYISLQAELSDTRSDRASLVILASLFRMVTEFTLIYIAFRYFFNATPAFPNGQQNPDAYPRFGLAFGIAMGILMLICTASLYPSVRRMRSYASSAPRRARSFFTGGLWRTVLVQNRNFRSLVLGVFTFAVASGLNTAFHLYLGTYLFHLTPPELAKWRQAINVGSFVSLVFFVTYLLRRFEIKPIFVASMAAYGVVEVLAVFLFLVGAWPPQIPVIWMLMTANFICGAINASNMVTPALLCSISADDHEYRTREPQQGLMFGLVHFAQKSGTGVGNLIAGVFLDLIKFPKEASVEAVSSSTIAPVAWFYVGGILVASVTAVWAFRGYRLKNADHDAVIAGFTDRRDDAAPTDPARGTGDADTRPREFRHEPRTYKLCQGEFMSTLSRRTALVAGAATLAWQSAQAAERELPAPRFRVVASGLRFPEGPVAMADGSVIVCEIAGRCLTKIKPDGSSSLVAQVGGGPNGAALGPDNTCYVCNNGGLSFSGPVSDEPLGSIQKVDLSTGTVSTVYRYVDGRPLIRPNDIVFDHTGGGFWFTDSGRGHARTQDYGSVYWGRADGSEIREVIFPAMACNGIALSPDGKTLYVAGVPGPRQVAAYEITGPGEVAQETTWTEFGRTRTGRRPKSRLVASLGGDRGFDSMRVDSAGNLIIGTTIMGGLTIISPDGKSIEHLPFADPMTTNLAFGGADLRTAFICLSSRSELIAMTWPRPGLRLAYQKASDHK